MNYFDIDGGLLWPEFDTQGPTLPARSFSSHPYLQQSPRFPPILPRNPHIKPRIPPQKPHRPEPHCIACTPAAHRSPSTNRVTHLARTRGLVAAAAADALVDGVEGAHSGRAGVEAGLALEGAGGDGHEANADQVGLADLKGIAAAVAVRGGTEAEVLVVRREDVGGDGGAVGDGVVGRKEAGCADFVAEGCVLVGLEGEDVFVVVDGDGALEDENADPAMAVLSVPWFVCFQRIPSSVSWQQITFGSLSESPKLVLCQPSKYFI
ncbi:hypothetical protein AOQ84DRAFT_391052 [Glonium stellatum]|uniref:Uncharacterized protein n=1 Tax=Glonium stellatum TaxID=574774 RepID=A0A8E2EUN6_9PEZI|nr:hypothetical protein AOQ84DRAFT_391052 [Glonium stellatum]